MSCKTRSDRSKSGPPSGPVPHDVRVGSRYVVGGYVVSTTVGSGVADGIVVVVGVEWILLDGTRTTASVADGPLTPGMAVMSDLYFVFYYFPSALLVLPFFVLFFS